MGFKVKERNQAVNELRKNGFIRKKKSVMKFPDISSRLKYLNSNLGKLPDQRFVDAVISMSSFYRKTDTLTEHQVIYLDYLITRVRD